jgi:hypothetical protein
LNQSDRNLQNFNRSPEKSEQKEFAISQQAKQIMIKKERSRKLTLSRLSHDVR